MNFSINKATSWETGLDVDQKSVAKISRKKKERERERGTKHQIIITSPEVHGKNKSYIYLNILLSN